MAHYDRRRSNPLALGAKAGVAWLCGKGAFRPWLQRSLQLSARRYFSYLEGLLDRPGKSLTGDITPAYAGLSDDIMLNIRDGFMSLGIGVKSVFIMRDPVERHVPAARMNLRKGAVKNLTLDEMAIATLNDEGLLMRSNYEATCDKVLKVFSQDSYYFGLYENMLLDSELRRLSDFSRYNFVPNWHRFGGIRTGAPMISATRQGELFLKATVGYDYCAERSPQTKSLWAQK